MKAQELRNLSQEELLEKEKALFEELSGLNMQRYSSRVEKPHKFALIKKDIARIQTILNSFRIGRLAPGKERLTSALKDKEEK